MNKLKVYNLSGEIIGEQELNPKIFEVAAKPELIEQVATAQRANSRETLAHTKTRDEVRGGGRKPWRQKGTGRARQGSIRAPQWKGGGVVFGPRKERNYTQKINKTMKRKALYMLLSDKVKSEQIFLFDSLVLAEAKTSSLVKIIKKLPVPVNSAILSLAKQDNKVTRAAKNIKKLELVAADSLNVVDLLKRKYLILDQAALAKLEAVYK